MRTTQLFLVGKALFCKKLYFKIIAKLAVVILMILLPDLCTQCEYAGGGGGGGLAANRSCNDDGASF